MFPPGKPRVLTVEPFGISDASERRLAPGVWIVDPTHSTATLRVPGRCGVPTWLRLRPPTGEVSVDFRAGAPSRALLWLPVGPRAAANATRRRWRQADARWHTSDFPEAALRLYTAKPAGHDGLTWRGHGMLTLGGLTDHVDLTLHGRAPVRRQRATYAGLDVACTVDATAFTPQQAAPVQHDHAGSRSAGTTTVPLAAASHGNSAWYCGWRPHGDHDDHADGPGRHRADKRSTDARRTDGSVLMGSAQADTALTIPALTDTAASNTASSHRGWSGKAFPAARVFAASRPGTPEPVPWTRSKEPAARRAVEVAHR